MKRMISVYKDKKIFKEHGIFECPELGVINFDENDFFNQIDEKLKESFTASGSIAGSPTRMGDVKRRDVKTAEGNWRETTGKKEPEFRFNARQNLAKAQEKIKHQKKLSTKLSGFLSSFAKNVKGKFKVTEMVEINEAAYETNDVLARLKNVDTTNKGGKDVVKYGIEDDAGNTMKITVKRDQAQEFEERIAQELSDIEVDRMPGMEESSDTSIAELLFKLKNEFDIIDVEFPQIPTDVVYNADKASMNVPDTSQQNKVNTNVANGGEMGMDDINGMDFGDEMSADGEEIDDGMMGDDESVQDFDGEETPDNSEGSLLTSIISMLKADAEAKTAQANAEAEKARAKQAEYSAAAASSEVARQEELMRMQAEIESTKQSEKEQRKIADLAKYRVKNASGKGMLESLARNFLLNESDEFDTPQSLSRAKTSLLTQYRVNAEDDQETKMYKKNAYNLAMKEINVRMQRARLAQAFKRRQGNEQNQKNQNQQQNQQNNQQQNNNNQQQNQQNNQQNGQ